MTKSERMKPVVQVAENREQSAAREFSSAQRVVEDLRQRLEALQQYRYEYRRRLEEAGRGGLTAAQFQQMQRFLSQLDHAIEHQHRTITTAEHTCEQRRRVWSEARSKRKALDNVVGRYRRQEQREDAIREQKEIDEVAQRKARSTR